MTSTGTRAEVEQLVAEGLEGLREHPEPLLTERFACMLGVPPSLVEASASDTTAIVEVLEEDGGSEALAVLLALERLIVSKWARAAVPAARRLLDAGVEPSSAPLELQVIKSFSGELGTLGVLGVHMQAGAAHFLATLLAQRTDDGSAHLDGGLAAVLDEDQVEARFAALRDTLESAVELPDPPPPARTLHDSSPGRGSSPRRPQRARARAATRGPGPGAPARSLAVARRGDGRRVAADASAGLTASG